jgi:hypothetical protein
MRSRCKWFDESCLCCNKVRARVRVRNGRVKSITLDRSCRLREGCGYEEKEEGGGAQGQQGEQGRKGVKG